MCPITKFSPQKNFLVLRFRFVGVKRNLYYCKFVVWEPKRGYKKDQCFSFSLSLFSNTHTHTHTHTHVPLSLSLSLSLSLTHSLTLYLHSSFSQFFFRWNFSTFSKSSKKRSSISTKKKKKLIFNKSKSLMKKLISKEQTKLVFF